MPIRSRSRSVKQACLNPLSRIFSGPLIAFMLGSLYIGNAADIQTIVPYFSETVWLFAGGSVLELLSEPGFVYAQQQLLFGVRASAETLATIARCFVTCGIAIWATRTNVDLGVLPFAFGQLAFAAMLNLVYYIRLSRTKSRSSFFLRPIAPRFVSTA